MNSTPTVFAVDDDPQILALIRAVVKAEKLNVSTFERPTAFLETSLSDIRGCLLLDYDLPEMTGLDVLRALSARKLDLPVILMTSDQDPTLPDRARAAGAVDFLAKPFSHVVLLQRIDRALAMNVNRPRA